MAGLRPHCFFYAASVTLSILTCAHGNSADSATVSRAAEIGSHANFVASRSPLVRSYVSPQAMEIIDDEAALAKNLSPMPPPNSLYLSEPKKFTFSADTQDLLLRLLLEGINKGFFVESGAGDGERESNTLYFERRREWTGLLVEPNPLSVPKLKAKGRQAYVFSGCLSDKMEHAWLGDLVASQGEHSHLTSENDSPAKPVPVTCAPLPSLLKLVGRSVVDLWSLNVEGSEVRVLNGMDFDTVEVGVLLVAAHEAAAVPEITSIMKAHGFVEAGRKDPSPKEAAQKKPTHLTFVNPKFFLKRGLRIPPAPAAGNLVKTDAVMLLDRQNKLVVKPNTTDTVDGTFLKNGTVAIDTDPGLSRWASVPLILVIAAMSIACFLKPEVKGPAESVGL